MLRILFVLHEASRTGAPFTQLHLMRWLKQHTDCKMLLVVAAGGELLPEFEELAEIYVVQKPYVVSSLGKRLLRRIGQAGGWELTAEKKLLHQLAAFKADLIFANTAAVLSYAAKLRQQLGVSKLVSYLHELEITFYHISSTAFATAAEQVDAFILGSEAVRRYYTQEFGIPTGRAHVIHDFIEAAVSAIPTAAASAVRARLGIPPTGKVVGGMASLIWRKGPELFVEVARRVLSTNPDVYFVWVGGKVTSPPYLELLRDVRLLGLTDRLLLPGEQADIVPFYDAFDIFLLTSREDPFPLVCLEAARAHTPVICFAEAGGMPEFVRDDAGAVVPYLDLDAMALKVTELLGDDALRSHQAQVAHDRVQQYYTIEASGPKIWRLLQTMHSPS